jgi:hypothetical protein
MCKKYSALIDDPYIAKRKQKYIDTPVNKSIIPFELVELKTGNLYILSKYSKNVANIYN